MRAPGPTRPRPPGSRYVGAEDVAGEVEAADDELVAALEHAVLVLDDHRAVVADGIERGEEAVPLDLAEPGQARHLPAHPERQHAVLVEAVRPHLEVLRVHMEDPVAEVVDRAL